MAHPVRWLFVLLILAVVFSTAAAPLTAQAVSPSAADMATTLRVDAGYEPDTLDPQRASYTNEVGALKLIYEGLTRLDSGLNTVPGAAESWAFNTGATQIEFLLRPGLQYSDGAPLNAKRFEFSILRALDPYIAGDYASLLDEISGAYEYRTADITTITPEELQALRDAVQVRAYDLLGNPCTGYSQLDCRVLRIGLTQSALYFPSIMSLVMTFPAREELIQAGGDDWWTSGMYQVGNGPFKMVTLDHSHSYYTPNPHYWRGQPGYNVEYQYFYDAQLSLQAYQANQLDIMPVAGYIADTVSGDPVLQAQLQRYAGACTYIVAFHNQKPPFNDPNVREAFAYAIDRNAWIDEVFLGGVPTLTWIPRGFPGYDANETRWGYNPTAAVQALASGGYTVVDGGLIGPDEQPIAIIDSFIDTPTGRLRHQWLIDQWYAVLGIEVVFNPVDAATYYELRDGDLANKPPLYFSGWCADYPDPQNWLSVYWKSTSSFAQRYGYNNPALDALLDEADGTIDPALRLQRYMTAQETLVADAPAIFLNNNQWIYLVKPRVIGEIGTPMDTIWMGEMDPFTIQVGYPLFLPAVVK